jgi:chaperonin GroES
LSKKIFFEPGPGKVAVEPDTGEKLTTSGIWLPGSERATIGTVIAIYDPFVDPADGEETVAFFKIGDRVIFGKHGGVEVQYEKRKAIILKEAEILTKVREEEDDTNE